MAPLRAWTLRDLPFQAGRRAVITGATGGLGYQTALALAGAGANVILTGRNAAKGWEAANRIQAAHPNAQVRFEALDVASLASVAAFAHKLLAQGNPIDLLVNNAGVMALPQRQLTPDGFEMQMGTNYLGHFALTARLLPLLVRGHRPRVVSLSSIAHRRGRIDLADFQGRRYDPWKAYGQSKLAMLMFALELQRRSSAGGWGVLSNAAHPGWARTDLFANGPHAAPGWNWQRVVAAAAAPVFSHCAAAGALPILYAATAPRALPGMLYGPSGVGEMKGPPAVAKIARHALDECMSASLWELSEELVSVVFETAAVGHARSAPVAA
ncbi:MAG TPA: SDR family oxidoreductase [Ramlibacter sp.]|nr:SDR family oxidoreductase [Ramlibacter sp.]